MNFSIPGNVTIVFFYRLNNNGIFAYWLSTFRETSWGRRYSILDLIWNGLSNLGIGTVVVDVFTSFSFQTHSDPFHTYSADADAMRHDVRVTTINNTVSDRILKMFFVLFMRCF